MKKKLYLVLASALFFTILVGLTSCKDAIEKELSEKPETEISLKELPALFKTLDTCDNAFSVKNGLGFGDLVIKHNGLENKFYILDYLVKLETKVLLEVRKGNDFYVIQTKNYHRENYLYFSCKQKKLFGEKCILTENWFMSDSITSLIQEDCFEQMERFDGREQNNGMFTVTDQKDSTVYVNGYGEQDFGVSTISSNKKEISLPWNSWPRSSHNQPIPVRFFGDKEVTICYFLTPIDPKKNNLIVIEGNGRVSSFYTPQLRYACGHGIDKKNREIRLTTCTGPLIQHESYVEEVIIKY